MKPTYHIKPTVKRGPKWRDEYNGQPTPNCPDCASPHVIRAYHRGSAASPECEFWYCESCGHDWGHD